MKQNKKQKKMLRCETPYCRKKSYGRKLCSTCRSQACRKKDPEKYAYNNLKASAKRRGISFTLTIEQFREFCIATDYIKGAGRTVNSFSVDRIDNSRGYELGNIRVLTVGENARKGAKKWLEYDWTTKSATVHSDFHKDFMEGSPVNSNIVGVATENNHTYSDYLRSLRNEELKEELKRKGLRLYPFGKP